MDTVTITTQVPKEFLTKRFTYFNTLFDGKFKKCDNVNLEFGTMKDIFGLLENGKYNKELCDYYGYIPEDLDLNKLIELDESLLHKINESDEMTELEEYQLNIDCVYRTVYDSITLHKGVKLDSLDKVKESFYYKIAKEFNMAIAGGYMTGMLKNGEMWEDSDVDLFFIGTEEIKKQKIQEIINYINWDGQTEGRVSYYVTDNAITVSCKNYKIQIILKQYNKIENLLNSFDIDCCKIAYYDNKFYCTQGSYYSLKYNVNITKDTKTWSNLTINRYLKYYYRGFDVMITNTPEGLVKRILSEKENLYKITDKNAIFYHKSTNSIVYGIYSLVISLEFGKIYYHNRKFKFTTSLNGISDEDYENCNNHKILEDYYSSKIKYSNIGKKCRNKNIGAIWKDSDVKVINYTEPFTGEMGFYDHIF